MLPKVFILRYFVEFSNSFVEFDLFPEKGKKWKNWKFFCSKNISWGFCEKFFFHNFFKKFFDKSFLTSFFYFMEERFFG